MEPVADPREEEVRDEENSKFKMNKKARLREEAELKQALVPNRVLNMYLVPRKLLVFDINKVLLHRQAKSSYFKIRPHAYAFIADMSERYTLAVWTSMTKKSAKPILAELFPQQHIPLLFNWYQNRCNSIPNEANPDGKPLFLKELSQVWREFPHFNESNTILVDDTSEKCARNPPHTSVQPCPYEPFGQRPPAPPAHNHYLPPASSIIQGSNGSAPSSSSAVEKRDENEIDLDLEETTAVDDEVLPPVMVSADAVVPAADPAELDLSAPEVGLIIADSQKEVPADEIIRSGAGSVPVVESDSTAEIIRAGAEPVSEVEVVDDAIIPTEAAPIAVESVDEETIRTEPVAVPAAPAAPVAAPPVFRFFAPPPSCGPPPAPVVALPPARPAPVNPYLGGEDYELVPGGPLWNYLDQLARHDGPVQEVVERLGSYRFY